MGRVVIVVADHPEEGGPYDEDPAIKDMMNELQARHIQPLRAHSVERLRKRLKKDAEENGRPEIVQIIGHGSRGTLLLGEIWTHEETGSETGPIYRINCNPDYLANLVDAVLKDTENEKTRVLLIGCEVGSSSGKGDAVADGPTLLFALAQLWGCEVCAPEVVAHSDTDFDDRGVYMHEHLLAHAHGLCVTPAGDKTLTKAQWVGIGAPRRSRG